MNVCINECVNGSDGQTCAAWMHNACKALLAASTLDYFFDATVSTSLLVLAWLFSFF
jgi:hypothetical protein